MQRKELTFDVVKILKAAAANLQLELFALVRSELEGRERKLLEYVFEEYYLGNKMAGRWYDPCHILLSTHFAIQLAKERKVPLIVPGIILHDIGYRATDKLNLLSAETRIIHMQEGAAMSPEALLRVGGFDSNEIGITTGMVATHDNWILGIPITTPDRLALTDADKIFVMSFISFYKDWLGGEGDGVSLEKFFDLRRHSFNEGKHLLHTSFARQWSDRQFVSRWREIQNDILKDERIFQQYAEKQILAELETDSGQKRR